MVSNFEFLEKDFPVLSNFGEMAEKYCYSDSNSCLMKLGMIGETIVNLMFTYDRISFPQNNTAVARIDTLSREGLLTSDLVTILHGLRKVRNKAVHENYASVADDKTFLPMAHSLCEWFMQTYGDWNYSHKDFVMPEENTVFVSVDKAAEEKKEAELTKLAEQTAEAAPVVEQEERKKQACKAANQRPKTEAETRFLIDEQLRMVGMIYRFLKTERFRRILFLVDRTALGEQAQDVFEEVKMEDLLTLDDIYNIKGLEDKTIDKETRIHISTVQGMVKRIMYNDGETMPAVSDYDLLIIDEAHRGYILDKEMGEDEALYRDQREYQSKYRSVIEYFNAVKIALTATPALQTTEIFGEPVFKYTYREAVIEGYLVDHDAPHELKTKLNTEGIHYKKGDAVTIYDPITGEIENSELIEDELDFDVDSFNKQVIVESFNRTVLEEIAKNIDPESPREQGKTLIYAVNDDHADMIVSILKDIYTEYGVDNDAIMKITGSVANGNKKKIQEAIKRFKNEDYPSIVVTVDLLTTGIDVPSISTLVFMRRVKSRILFEQMLGRATRLCKEIHKTHFDIYDPVGVYDALEDVNTMKPVVANPSTSFTQLLDGLEELNDEAHVKNQINQVIAKLQRKKKNIDEKTMEHFIDMSGGMDPTQFVADIQRRSPEDATLKI